MNGLVLWSFVYANDRLYVGNAGHIYQSYIRLIYTNHTYESYIRMIVCVWAMQAIYTNDIYESYIRKMFVTNMNGLVLWSSVYANDRLFVGNAGHIYDWNIQIIHVNTACHKDEWCIAVRESQPTQLLYTCSVLLQCLLQCVAVCLRQSTQLLYTCIVLLQCVAVCWCVLQRVAVCCSALQCDAVWCSVMQCVAVCCSVLQCVAVWCSVLQCASVYCSLLQCVAVCCSVLYWQHIDHIQTVIRMYE